MEKTVLITGASSGIGSELANVFAKNGYNLILHGRNKLALEDVQLKLQRKFGRKISLIIADLTQKDAAKNMYETLKDKAQIDILINNAGFGLQGEFTQTSVQKETDMIHVNITALTQLTKYFAQDMKKKEQGTIINVASTAAFQPGPYMAVYFATKAYVLSFTEAIAYELKDANVQVMALCPGPTQSEFAKRADMKGNSMFNDNIPTAKEVAEFTFKEMKKGTTVAVHGKKNQSLKFLTRFIPRNTATKIVGKMQKKDINNHAH